MQMISCPPPAQDANNCGSFNVIDIGDDFSALEIPITLGTGSGLTCSFMVRNEELRTVELTTDPGADLQVYDRNLDAIDSAEETSLATFFISVASTTNLKLVLK